MFLFRLWDTDSGEEIQSYNMESSYSDVRFYNDDNCVIVAGHYSMFALDVNTEEIVYEEDVEGLYGKCIDIMDDGKTLLHIGGEKIRVYRIDGQNIVSIDFCDLILRLFIKDFLHHPLIDLLIYYVFYKLIT